MNNNESLEVPKEMSLETLDLLRNIANNVPWCDHIIGNTWAT